MKQLLNSTRYLLVFVLLLGANQAFSKVLTVSNNPASLAQYNDLPTAVNAASAGDTIYVQGSVTAYADITIKKRLVLIGPGYVPINPTLQPAYVANITLDSIGGLSGASGTYILGMTFNYLQETSNYSAKAINNITIKRCRINSYAYIGYSNTTVNNWVVQENQMNALYYNINASTSTNILVNNNLISYSGNIQNTIFTNNVIFGVPTFSQCSVSNCIFYVGSGYNNSTDHTNFTNNLFMNSVNFTASPNTNTFTPSIQITGDPLFTNANSYNTNGDYHLSTGSPGKNYGTDGKDIGIYGGGGFVDGGNPAIPMVYFYNLKPNYVQANGTLNVTISVKNQ